MTATAPTLPREAETALALCSEPQRRFVLAFLRSADPGLAAQEAGVPAHRIEALFKQAAVQRVIRAFWASSGGDALVSIPWVIERLKTNVERALQAEPVRDAEGALTGEFRYEGSVANRGLELLGKYLGMFVEKAEVKHTHEILILDTFRPSGEVEDDLPPPRPLIDRKALPA